MSKKELPHLLFWNDTETSTANPANGQILESAWIVTNPDLEVLAKFQFDIRWEYDRGFKWDKSAQAVHGITKVKAEQGPNRISLHDYILNVNDLPKFMAKELGYEFKAVFLAQNAFFDFAYHKCNAEKMGLEFESFGYKPFDTSVLFAQINGWRKSGLSHYLSKEDESSQLRHNALYDTEKLLEASRKHLGFELSSIFG